MIYSFNTQVICMTKWDDYLFYSWEHKDVKSKDIKSFVLFCLALDKIEKKNTLFTNILFFKIYIQSKGFG